MKLRSYFFGALACLALASCSSDDDATVSGEYDPNTNQYVAISIVNPQGTRGTGGDFLEGSNVENNITKATLIFYDAAGNYLTSATPTFTWPNPNQTESTPAVEKVSEAVVVLSNLKSAPRSVIAVLNADLAADEITKSMADFKNIIGTSKRFATFTDGKFVMTNSVYANNCEVKLTDSNLQQTEIAAKGNPVVIYVERLAAKVEVKAASSTVNAAPKTETVDGATTTIYPQIKSYKIISTNPASYLVKNIDGNSGWAWTGWNDATNKRSYWANSATPATPDTYEYSTYNSMTGAPQVLPFTSYCLENTGKDKDDETATTLMLTAQLTTDVEGNNPISLVYFKGMYFTETGFKNYVATQLQLAGYKFTTDGSVYSDNWANRLSIVRAAGAAAGQEAWKVVASVDLTGITAYQGAANGDAISNAVAALGTAMMWKDGAAYYFVTIEHFGDVDGFKYGVVRNHIYDITVSGTTGLGSPVFDPTEIIIPERPVEVVSHVAAQIKILKWKIVQQHDVVLQ